LLPSPLSFRRGEGAFGLCIHPSIIPIENQLMSDVKDLDIKSKVNETIRSLPDDASWNDVMYRIYVTQKIERGLKDVKEGDTVSLAEVRKRFGLSQ